MVLGGLLGGAVLFAGLWWLVFQWSDRRERLRREEWDFFQGRERLP